MMELHQFRHSAFCLKVRMVLQAKGLSYRTVDVTPGIGQVAVFRMSGQRQVPVLVDGDVVLADSSAIARHLEQRETSSPLIPVDVREAAQARGNNATWTEAERRRAAPPWDHPARSTLAALLPHEESKPSARSLAQVSFSFSVSVRLYSMSP